MSAYEGRYELVVVGGGLVGLATARAFLRRRPDARLAVVEKEHEVGFHQSGHNSGVVHAGVYYPAGSLKAELCREGREELRRFADEHGIPYRVCGKLVVAIHESELERLAELQRRSEANGLQGIRVVDRAGIRELEPHVDGIRGLHVPETAVIDFRLVSRAIADDLVSAGADVLCGLEVSGIERNGQNAKVRLANRDELAAARVVTCAGLQSDRVAAKDGISRGVHRVVPFRGSFYRLSPTAARLVQGLVYPVPDPAFPFLGVHFTRRIDGEVWAGPNAVPTLARERYRRAALNLRDARDLLSYPGMWRLARRYFKTGVRELWRDTFRTAALAEMRRYLPDLELEDLSRGPCGIRAQALGRSGELVDDFLLEGDTEVMHVCNAPSPAATASLAIGARIVDEVLGRV
jgi:L-2-hydroxyglutarate oxidase LhgO